ncbi:MAG: hypothetical protein WCG34_00005, partial [Leptolinea sp.]
VKGVGGFTHCQKRVPSAGQNPPLEKYIHTCPGVLSGERKQPTPLCEALFRVRTEKRRPTLEKDIQGRWGQIWVVPLSLPRNRIPLFYINYFMPEQLHLLFI